MAMRETVGSMRVYLILVGVGTCSLFSLGIAHRFREPLFLALGVPFVLLGFAHILSGLFLRRLLLRRVGLILAMFWAVFGIGGALAVVYLLASDFRGLVSPAIEILILQRQIIHDATS